MKPLQTALLVLAIPLTPLVADVRITEFLASNDDGLKDDNGNRSDWIEIHNNGDSSVNLEGWTLTDDPTIPGKWAFPDVSIPADGRIVIFASGEDRAIPGLPLHTNFALSKNGEYLALREGDGTTIATEFSPAYPIQTRDVSYGREDGTTIESVITFRSPGIAGVPTSLSQFNSQFSGWNTNIAGTFDGTAWKPVTLGVGYETSGGTYGDLIGGDGDIQTAMHMVNPSVFLRIPFAVTMADKITSATLRMRWDDGFAAFLNGQPVASDRAHSPAEWNSRATEFRNDGLNSEQIHFPINLSSSPLVEGANLLAIQGFNFTANDSDMLIQPELVLIRSAATADGPVYFPKPSPGEANGTGEAELAPIFENLTDQAASPPTGIASSPPLTVTAELRKGTHDIQSVKAHYRTMFGAESDVALHDDGIGADATADDGTYSGMIPTSQVGAGEMLRWRFEATDINNHSRVSPAFVDPLNNDRYYGTVAIDPDIATANLPVIQTFVEDPAAIDTRAGGRVSLHYLGRFYDNVRMDLHGGATTSPSFLKKSHDLDFNDDNRFKWKEGENKVKDINFLTNYADKSKVRNTLAYELYKTVGAGYHFAFPVRIEQNGRFHSVADVVEDGDDRFLERLGLDPAGALYKIYDRLEDPANSVKKTRKDEDTQDLQDFIDRIATKLTLNQIRKNAYDHINIAATINHLVANQIIAVTDTGSKNYYLYRDTEGTGEWRPLPWDVDLSLGRRWSPTEYYYDDVLHTGFTTFNNNPLFELIFTTPEFKDMWVRRFETLRRQIYQSPNPSPADDWFRNKVIATESMINPPGTTSDGDLDFAQWGSWGDNHDSLPASRRIYNEWLPRHRSFIFGNPKLNGTPIPPTQPAVPNIIIDSIDENPGSGRQNEEYVILKNNSGGSVDLSGWTLRGAIEYTFPGGTVILSGNGSRASGYKGLIHIAKNPAAFRARASGPSGSQYRYIQGPYSGQLSARGETLTLHNGLGTLVDEFTIAPNPTAAQQYLRVTEVHYHPADPDTTELTINPAFTGSDFEFIELINTGPSPLVLDGASFIEGITFTFPASTTLPSGAMLIVASNPAALVIRHPSISAPIHGPFSGHLDNSGERIQLIDGDGENILDFTYSDHWYPPSDGGGASLVLRDTAILFNEFDKPSSWGSSPEPDGTPGSSGAGYLIHFNGWQAEHYLPSEQLVGQPGHPDTDDDSDGWTLWYEYALGMDPEVADAPSFIGESTAPTTSGKFGIRFPRRPLTSDVSVELLASTRLSGFSPVSGSVEANPRALNTRQESILLHDSESISATPAKFYQLRITPLAPTP